MPSAIKSIISNLFLTHLLLLCALPSHSGAYQEAVQKLGFSELAKTFSQEKAQAITQKKPGEQLNLAELQALAVLKILGAPNDEKSLIEFVAQYDLRDTAYLGQLGEPSLYQRIETIWLQSNTKPHSDFATELRKVIGQGIATGYNIYTTPWPKFTRERHLVYGHNDIDHAQQLLALLASEKLQARVGFSLKTSAFLYRDDWGTLTDPIYDPGNNRRMVEALEYDLHFEFPMADEKIRFMQIINTYAKKDRADQTGLIRSTWWQPYYRSLVTAPDYQPVTQVLVSNGAETAVLLALSEKAPALVKNILILNKDWQVTPEAIWVNPAFYRYLQGGYK